jgi:carbohydrate binding protein with CBM6 domain/beta-propeller repeat-containing protein
MSRYASIPTRRMLVLFPFLAGFILPAAAVTDARVSESYGKLPLHFEANRGQTDKDVRFLSRGAGYSLYLTADEAVLVLAKPNADAKRDAKTQVKSVALRMSLVGAARRPVVSGLEEQAGKANYFTGKDPAKWRTNVQTYAKVHYQNVYPGIDLVYYGNQRKLEYDFVVAPGADPKKIVLAFKGADKVEIDARGDLVLHSPGGDIRQHKPIVYQEIDGIRQEIAGRYVRKGANRVGFQVAAYDRSRPLVIDPVLVYSTYLGGGGISSKGDDLAYGIALDADRNAYVAGSTTSANFPTTAGAFDTTVSSADVFVTKLNATGSALVYSTYLGGGFDDSGRGIAVDAAGNAYVTGYTRSSNFPTTTGAFQTTFGGYSDAFVTKLNPTGSALVYSTYLGGVYGYGIAVDAAGNAYVTGDTGLTDLPATAGAFQPTPGGQGDAFVTKLNPAGSALVYFTYLGGADSDAGSGIALDASGNAYVMGYTSSSNFPTTTGAFQTTCGGGFYDVFVTKLNPAGSALVYSTYLGGSGRDIGNGVAIDTDGNAYLTGFTESPDFPATPGAFQTTIAETIYGDAFVTKLDASGAALVYSTYLGGSRGETGNGIAVDAAGNAYVTGNTVSTDFPTTPAAIHPTNDGNDVFVTKLNPTGSTLVYSTYLGAGAGYGIALDATGDAYVAGFAFWTNFPTTTGAFQPNFGGGTFDAFVAKISDTAQIPAGHPTPFYRTPFAIPGTFEAEDFDLGGEGIAYHDNVPGNAGGQYRLNEDVDIIASSDSAGGGYVVKDFETGEWLNYTINVQNTTNYDIELRVSSAMANSAFHVEIDGLDVTGSTVVPNTGSWDAFQWVGKKAVALGAGQHVLKIVADQQYFNLNSVRVLPTTTRFQERTASYTGFWQSYSTETGTFSGGNIVASNRARATAGFTFTGTAVSWIGVKCNVCGIAAVSIDGGVPTAVDTFGPSAPGSLTSEVVFSASGLASGVTHTLVITVTGTGAAVPGSVTWNSYVAVDAFDVTR